MRPYEAAGTPRWPNVEVRYQLSSLGPRPLEERAWRAGGQPRRFFRIPFDERKRRSEKEKSHKERKKKKTQQHETDVFFRLETLDLVYILEIKKE